MVADKYRTKRWKLNQPHPSEQKTTKPLAPIKRTSWLATILNKGVAYGVSIIHPVTLARTFGAVLRGLSVSIQIMNSWVRVEDKPELRQAGQTGAIKHAEEAQTRRRILLFVMLLDAAGLGCLVLAIGRESWVKGAAIWAGIHVVAFFFIGRTGPVLRRVQTAYMVGEFMLRSAINEMTLPTAALKQEATTLIMAPGIQNLSTGRGWEVTVRIHSMGDPQKLVNGPKVLAHKIQRGASTVYTYGVKGDASLVRIVGLNSDPWNEPPTHNPLVEHPRPVNLWREKVNLGVRPDGFPWLRQFAEAGDGAGALVGGAPRQGKSVFLGDLLVPIMLHAGSRIHLIDGKAVDFAFVKPVCTSYIGEVEMEDLELLNKTIAVLEKLKAEVHRRRKIVLSLGKPHISEEMFHSHGLSLEWLIIDELATFTEQMMAFHKKEVMRFLELLLWLLSKGATFGVLCVLATQRPSKESIPDTLRSLIVWRTAFYIASQTGSYSITGKRGDANRADLLDLDQKGVCITTGEGQVRPHLVLPDDLQRVAEYAMVLRVNYGRPPETGAVHPELVRQLLTVFEAHPAEKWLSLTTLCNGLGTFTPRALAGQMRTSFGMEPAMGGPNRDLRGYLRAALEAIPKVQPVGRVNEGPETTGPADTGPGPVDGSGRWNDDGDEGQADAARTKGGDS